MSKLHRGPSLTDSKAMEIHCTRPSLTPTAPWDSCPGSRLGSGSSLHSGCNICRKEEMLYPVGRARGGCGRQSGQSPTHYTWEHSLPCLSSLQGVCKHGASSLRPTTILKQETVFQIRAVRLSLDQPLALPSILEARPLEAWLYVTVAHPCSVRIHFQACAQPGNFCAAVNTVWIHSSPDSRTLGMRHQAVTCGPWTPSLPSLAHTHLMASTGPRLVSPALRCSRWPCRGDTGARFL